MYEDFACNSVTGTISKASLKELQNAVRTRALELTIQIEKSIPAAAEIYVGPPAAAPAPKDKEIVTQITQQTVYGNYTSIANVSDNATVSVSVSQGDVAALAKTLSEAGLSQSDADDLSKIIASEKPEGKEEPFGKKAKAWIVKNIGKAVDGTWKVGVSVATKVITEAAMRYYGLK